MNKLLLLEDDTLFRETLEDFLEEYNYEVKSFKNGEDVLDSTFKEQFDIYLFDINVPKINGLELLKILRDSGDNTPAIFITSYNDQETLHQGFEVGADDYIKKPVDLDELYFRIQALLKRSGQLKSIINLTENIVLDKEKMLLYQNDNILNISQKVVMLIELFSNNRDNVVTKDQIIEHLWHNELPSDGSIRVYISQIKKLLGNQSITNIKGVGYKIQF